MSRIIANFVLKFPNSRYHGNKGHSLVNLNVAIKLRDLENLLFGAIGSAISLIQGCIVIEIQVIEIRN